MLGCFCDWHWTIMYLVSSKTWRVLTGWDLCTILVLMNGIIIEVQVTVERGPVTSVHWLIIFFNFFHLPQDDFSISELCIWVLYIVHFLSDLSQRGQACSLVLLLSHLACCKYNPLLLNKSWAAIHKQYVIETAETG